MFLDHFLTHLSPPCRPHVPTCLSILVGCWYPLLGLIGGHQVNKIIWSAVSWGADTTDGPINGTALALAAVVDYATVFVGHPLVQNVSSIIIGLEQAWIGPLRTNDAVSITQATVAAIESTFRPRHAYNWRLQQLRYRAHYDTFIQIRSRREEWEEATALGILSAGGQTASAAMAAATTVLLGNNSLQALSILLAEAAAKAKVEVLAGELFHSIKMQLSVPKYFAEYTVRGANLDTLELPLNNAPYLLKRFDEIKALPLDQQLSALDALANWADAGEDGFYDDLGSPGNQPHLVVPKTWEEDPDYYRSPLDARAIAYDVHWSKRFETPPASLAVAPVPWQTVVTTFYNAPLTLRYENLSRGGHYTVQVVYALVNVYEKISAAGGSIESTPPPTTRLVANGFLVHDLIPPPTTQRRLSFSIPAGALASTTTLELVWTMPDNVGGSGAGNYVAEVLVTKSK